MGLRPAEGLRSSLPAGLPCGSLCSLQGRCECCLPLQQGQHPATLPRAPGTAALGGDGW